MTSTLPLPATRMLGSDVDRLVQVGGVDQVEPEELLLRLGERNIGDQHLVVPHARRRRITH
jgi:hypothetical protein